jgi:hypothetical protein
MKHKKVIVITTLLMLIFAGCAQKSSDIKATYASPMKYQSYSCKQLGSEMTRVTQRAAEISGQQDSTATKDAVVMTVGLVVFAPALLFLAQGEDQKVEIGRLKGEYNAIRDVAMRKHCSWAKNLQIR